MLDRQLLRNDPERVRRACEAKGEPCHVDRWLEVDSRRRELLTGIEELRRRRNELSREVSRIKREGGEAGELMEESRSVGRDISREEGELSELEEELGELELAFPNLPDGDVPVGRDESDNAVLRSWGEPGSEGGAAPHWEVLGETLDGDAAAGVAAANFVVLRGWAARLQRELIGWMMDRASAAGMEEVWTPFLASRESMTTTAQIPKLEEDMYLVEQDDLFLVPTGEVPITNLYRGAMLDESELPVRLVGYTPCFRREAGSYGRETRGLNRVHQFEKVEMVRLEHPDRSDGAMEEMIAYVESLLRELELPYRVSLLATGDLSFAAARCCDLEVWSAGQQRWLEVSSVSNFRDFQARRGRIRFRPDGGGKPGFVHTLNGSALALPRIIAALVERGAREDGSVRLPRVIEERMEGSLPAP